MASPSSINLKLDNHEICCDIPKNKDRATCNDRCLVSQFKPSAMYRDHQSDLINVNQVPSSAGRYIYVYSGKGTKLGTWSLPDEDEPIGALGTEAPEP